MPAVCWRVASQTMVWFGLSSFDRSDQAEGGGAFLGDPAQSTSPMKSWWI
jgi:hypothetical protein